MWELALLIVAIAFAVLVMFTIPALLQARDSLKELEFTLRETRDAVQKLREVTGKAEEILAKGKAFVGGAEKAFASVAPALGKSGAHTIGKILTIALEAVPVALAAQKLFTKLRRRD